MRQRSKTLKGKKFTVIGQGMEARVYKVEQNERRRVVRKARRGKKAYQRYRFGQGTKRRFLVMKIAHELFPSNTVKPVAFDAKKGRIETELSPPDKTLEEYQALRHQMARTGWNPAKEEIKERFMEVDVQLAESRSRLNDWVEQALSELTAAGFEIDTNPPNISLANPRKPVFYEISVLDTRKTRRYLAGLSAGKRKKVEALLQELEGLKKS